MKSWKRVTQSNRCQHCLKSDWCLVSEDGAVSICMRVQSTHPHQFKDGSVGWIHRSGDSKSTLPNRIEHDEPEAYIDCATLMEEWRRQTKPEWIRDLAQELGLANWALKAMGVAWSHVHRAWAFPMCDGHGSVIGIRLRRKDGSKLTVKGTHNGLFIPQLDPAYQVLVAEGPTDTAALLGIGYYAIGRPSCSGGVNDIVSFIARRNIRRVVLVADNDEPGLRGSQTLAIHLPVPNVIVVLDTKDAREFVCLGGDRDLMECLISQQVWRQPHATQRSELSGGKAAIEQVNLTA